VGGKAVLYMPMQAWREGRDTTLPVLDFGVREGLVVSAKPRPPCHPERDHVPILQEAE